MNETRDERRSALEDFAAMKDVSPPVSKGALATIENTHVGAIAVAVKRDEVDILRRIKAIAAAAGTDFFYRFPVKNRKENRTDWIEGPSIKLANEVARIFGNCETDVRVQDLGDQWLFYARFIDLETGFSMTRPFQQRKSAGKIGGDDDARRLDIAFQIGASKAIRNVVVNALQTFSDFAFEEARNSLVDRIGKDLENYRQKTAERIAAKIDIKRVEAVVGRVVKDWLAPDIARVIAMLRAVADGMATWDETFPPLDGGDKSNSGATTLDSFAGSESDAAPHDDADPNPATSKESSRAAADPAPDGKAAAPKTANKESRKDGEPDDLKAGKLQKLKAGIAISRDEAAVNAVWESLDLDNFYNDDPIGRREAWKLCTDRVAELKGGEK